ncbi:penicillin-binding protein 2 [Izhakiella capsodis]|uniref:Peptidoglycan D,D-transpeptidase MrdA n=1 Tax=Izhakiella capsodis TaxID=1367852 RepID=A0A1I4VZ06_9GAMM|nr:penicillin-binding protein 2 [Izhakiella capsodis]SFN06395.1 penicillin-binding protein 2 [Izhakiella capsodis]
MNLPDFERQEKLFNRRSRVALGIVLTGFLILLSNLWHLQIDDHHYYQTRSNENDIKMIPLAPRRGIIYDRNGIPLVRNVKKFDLAVMPYKIHNMKALIKALTPVVYLTPDDIKTFWQALKQSSRYRNVVLKDELTNVEMARFAVNQFKFGGVSINSYYDREYPYGAALSHVIGYVSRISDSDYQRLKKTGELENYLADRNIGKQGIESYYEKLLHGQTGYQEVEVDNHGRIVRVLKKVPPVAGKNIYLTLDLPLQLFVEKQLPGQRAAVLIENPKDASVLAMVSCPGYDPNPFVKGISFKAYHQLLTDKDLPLINRVTQGLYPPASTVKPYIAMSALLDKVITPQTELYSGPTWTIPGTKHCYHDWNRNGHGMLDVTKAIEESADTFFYQVAFEMGIDRIHAMLSQFGYGKMTGIDLHEEYPGLLPSRPWKMRAHHQPWYQGDTISVGIGQGYWIATPIQMVKALVTLLNNGRVMSPHLMSAAKLGNQTIHYKSPMPVGQVASTNSPYWALIRKAMFGMANSPDGTGYKYFHSAPYGIAAKSGTAQVFSLKKNQIYNAKTLPLRLRDNILYTAFAPYKHPTVAMALVLENGGDNGIVAGPVVRHILDYMFLKGPTGQTQMQLADQAANKLN